MALRVLVPAVDFWQSCYQPPYGWLEKNAHWILRYNHVWYNSKHGLPHHQAHIQKRNKSNPTLESRIWTDLTTSRRPHALESEVAFWTTPMYRQWRMNAPLVPTEFMHSRAFELGSVSTRFISQIHPNAMFYRSSLCPTWLRWTRRVTSQEMWGLLRLMSWCLDIIVIPWLFCWESDAMCVIPMSEFCSFKSVIMQMLESTLIKPSFVGRWCLK